MTKVDERAVVPEVDASARERLAGALDQDGVVAAYLFGSQASGAAGPLSDVDLAVWVDPGLGSADRLELRRRLAGAAAAAVGSDEVDVVVLNGAPRSRLDAGLA